MIAIRNVYTKHRHVMNFVPFIDVVFMLLIYFFVAAEIRPTEADFTTNLPGDGERNLQARPENLKEVYHVYLKVLDGDRVEVSVDGTALGVSEEGFSRLERCLDAVPDKEHMSIEINGDHDVTVQSIAHTLDAAMAAKVPSVRFAKPRLGI